MCIFPKSWVICHKSTLCRHSDSHCHTQLQANQTGLVSNTKLKFPSPLHWAALVSHKFQAQQNDLFSILWLNIILSNQVNSGLFSVSQRYSWAAVLHGCGEERKICAWWELNTKQPNPTTLYLGKPCGLVICSEQLRWSHFQVFIGQDLHSPRDLLQGSTVWAMLLWWLASSSRLRQDNLTPELSLARTLCFSRIYFPISRGTLFNRDSFETSTVILKVLSKEGQETKLMLLDI